MKRLVTAVLLCALSLTGCGDDDPAIPSSSGTPGAATKPTVSIPAGPAPTSLVVEDITQGTGAEAVPGSTVTVQYVGVAYSTREEFDASWNSGEPLEFQLPGNVIAGWNEGIPGMKVGGRRKLTIPPDKAYGVEGRPPVIKSNETLVFVVDLLAVS